MDVQLYRKVKEMLVIEQVMESKEKTIISVQTKINVPIEKAWKFWTTPEDIIKWNNASDDWQTTRAENDLRAGGRFDYRMEAKDGSNGFDFTGVYTKVKINKQIDYTIGDERKVKVVFSTLGDKTEVAETFEAENIHSIEIQRNGWQSILNNFKKYTEAD
jgi:uncharacterized protein YndB with AHSA1/START domain